MVGQQRLLLRVVYINNAKPLAHWWRQKVVFYLLGTRDEASQLRDIVPESIRHQNRALKNDLIGANNRTLRLY
jgi:hypothetical protein